MDRIHPPFEDEYLEVTLNTDDSDSDADIVISALHRTAEDLDTTFETDNTLFDDSATVPDDKKLNTAKQNQPWHQKQPLSD